MFFCGKKSKQNHYGFKCSNSEIKTLEFFLPCLSIEPLQEKLTSSVVCNMPKDGSFRDIFCNDNISSQLKGSVLAGIEVFHFSMPYVWWLISVTNKTI